jgi:hypothetical protein
MRLLLTIVFLCLSITTSPATDLPPCTSGDVAKIIIKKVFEQPRAEFLKRQEKQYAVWEAKDETTWPYKKEYLRIKRAEFDQTTNQISRVTLRLTDIRQVDIDSTNQSRYCAAKMTGVDLAEPWVLPLAGASESFNRGYCEKTLYFKIELLQDRPTPYVSWKCSPFSRRE